MKMYIQNWWMGSYKNWHDGSVTSVTNSTLLKHEFMSLSVPIAVIETSIKMI